MEGKEEGKGRGKDGGGGGGGGKQRPCLLKPGGPWLKKAP